MIYIIYDPLDRVVLVQSGNLRSSDKWLYSKYDASGRVITEGVYTDATHTTRSGMQSYVDGLSCYGSSSTTYYEARTTGTSSYYTNSCFPASGTEERLYYYYDDYDTNNDGSADFAYSSQGLSGEGPVTDKTRGLPTAINKRIIGTSNWLRTVSFYDKRLNPLQVQSDNQLRALLQDHTTTVIDFAGRLNIKNEYNSTSSTANITVRADYSYDGMKRLTEVGQVINGSSRVIVARYEYNALGSLVDKKLHSTNGITYLQSVDYRYNIRGQLTSINNSTLTSDGGATNDDSNDLWGMDLLYEQQEYCNPGSCDVEVINNTSNWTGRISAVKWKASVSGGNTDQRAYVFSYDLAGRMTTATYKAYNNSTTGWTKHPNGYNEEVSYDENGNIATMLRKAVIAGSVTTIDNMTYDYGSAADNNKLLNMTETGSNSYGYRNFTSNSTGYSYDNNGNLTADDKKGTTITYNELNKPVRITQTSTGKYVEYGYDAAGVRLSKTVNDGSTTKTYNYIAGLFYDENNALSYFSMAEGRVRNASGTFTYEYFITDHQGNVRVSFEDNGSGTAVVRQENSYYPFGLAMPGNTIPSSPNNHLYNAGSELQDEFSGIIDYYSTFFREYDPVLGRFNGVDPQATATMELSIYHYSGNDPVNFNDPMGDLKAASDVNGLLNYLLNINVNSLNGPDIISFSFGEYGYVNGIYSFETTVGGGGSSYDLEHEVIELSREGKYKDAYFRIINYYSIVFGISQGKYRIITSGIDYGHSTRLADPSDKDKYNTEEVIVSLSSMVLDWLIPENKATQLRNAEGKEELLSYLNHLSFGDVIRQLYHETVVHVLDLLGRNEFGKRPEEQAEREFRGYYQMWAISGLKEVGGGLKFYNWKNAALGSDPRKGAYFKMSVAKQNYYKRQWNEMMGFLITNYFKYIINN
ncbi:MAG: hypothetical protein IPQ08_07610 [Chitinophagaceae bacterium]|nr:hypothetical protein [Chitinophagaceae bacterium]